MNTNRESSGISSGIRRLGRKNSLNIDIIEQFNKLNQFNQNAVLYSFESSSLDDLINTSGKKHAVRKFMLDIINWLILEQEKEQSLDFCFIEQV